LNNFRNKKILITAGPTWVPIDSVRVISNVATGKTGILLAEKLLRLGADVHLALGPVESCCIEKKMKLHRALKPCGFLERNTERQLSSSPFKAKFSGRECIKLVRFKFFDELLHILENELRNKKYDIVIHSAAVSDYRPKLFYRKKVKSGLKKWKLNLLPTPKIISQIKKLDGKIFLVGFKFETEMPKGYLIGRSRILMERSQSELVVANTFCNNRYQAYIVSKKKVSGPVYSREELTKKLINEIKDAYARA